MHQHHGDHVVHCPPSAPSDSRGEACAEACCRRCCCLFVTAAAATAIVLLIVFIGRRFPEKDPAYSAAISGVAGMDAVAVASGAPLSPVFNLMLRIDNTRNSKYTACVGGLATAVVSYGDAPLARGSVPPFCAKKMREREGEVARAWGRDVALPPFLREQLAGELRAGEAAVDVKVTVPATCYDCSDEVLSCSKVRIGGGPSRCRLDYVYPRHEAAAGSSD